MSAFSCFACALFVSAAAGQTITQLASYEAAETNLTLSRPTSDAGLTLAIVDGGVGGAPAATHGSRVLRLTISNEADRKVEFRHNWTGFTYNLAGNDELLVDVFIATAGARPTVMGVFDDFWNPPSAWQPATNIPTTVGVWTTISMNVSAREQIGLNRIWALVFENMVSTSGTAYVDNVRLRSNGPPPSYGEVAAVGYEDHNLIQWKPASIVGLQGYHVDRAAAAGGPFTRLTAAPITAVEYRDPQESAVRPTAYYRVVPVANGVDSTPSVAAGANYNGMTDDQLLNDVQLRTFRYFWDYGHPFSGMARESNGLGHPSDTVTTGGSGFGLMTIVVGAERGFVTRAAAARIVRIVRFLDGANPDNPSLPSGVQRYHGAWSHWMNGATGATIAFAGAQDNGGDLVETAFLVQGLLTVRQYFDDPVDPVETEIRDRCTQMWEEVEWSWYRRFANGSVLYWHWSPNFGWALNLPIRGYNEGQIIYLLAAASPTFPIPASVYATGWAGGAYVNGSSYYGYPLQVGEPFGGPLFFTHYSNLGFDPRYKRDAYANYFVNARNMSLINREHCLRNPFGFAGYSPMTWGLTASFNPFGYSAHSPTNDNGTITPTAAISAMPYVPRESLIATRHMLDRFGTLLYGFYGFRDAFHVEENWYAPGWLAIDQGTIAPMIENYRSGLCWRLFMSNPEILPMMESLGYFFEIDFDSDGDVDIADFAIAGPCANGPQITTPPPGCLPADFADSDLDDDGDVDAVDLAISQRIFTGAR
ncbi:MAG: glucoamylase family protein [Phycisphaerae bacterium]|nr:glucoamylase family protein [Phycisphaerae bacterium]